MPRKNRNKAPRIHGSALLQADASLITGVRAVADRLADLRGAYRRLRGIDLIQPPELDHDVVRFHALLDRFQGADFRYTEPELRSLKAIADWSLQTNAKLRNQKPPKVAL